MEEMLPPDLGPLPVRETEPDNGVLNTLDRFLVRATKILFSLGAAGIVGMLLLTVADVVGIKILSRPVPGGIEYITFLSVIMIAFSVAYTQVMRGHVAVDFIIEKFPRRAKLIVDACMMLFSVCLFALLAYYSFRFAGKLRAVGEVSMTQNIPFYPFVYAMGVCFVVTFLVLVMDFVKSIGRAVAQWTR